MRSSFLNLVSAEWFLMRKRSATWILLGIWALVAAIFGYVLPYYGGPEFSENVESLFPGALAETIGAGFPFYGGALALILGVLTLGSEYGWNTWKTILTQRPGRRDVFAAKSIVLLGMMLVFSVVAYVTGAITSVGIALLEDAAITWPSLGTLVAAIGSGWLILSVWAATGVVLAMLTRGTSLAIGIGIMWGLAFEGLLGMFIANIGWLDWMVDFMIRANGYSLMQSATGQVDISAGGPGAFSGPFVSGTQAMIVLVAYLAAFFGISGWLLRRRDID